MDKKVMLSSLMETYNEKVKLYQDAKNAGEYYHVHYGVALGIVSAMYKLDLLSWDEYEKLTEI